MGGRVGIGSGRVTWRGGGEAASSSVYRDQGIAPPCSKGLEGVAAGARREMFQDPIIVANGIVDG